MWAHRILTSVNTKYAAASLLDGIPTYTPSYTHCFDIGTHMHMHTHTGTGPPAIHPKRPTRP